MLEGIRGNKVHQLLPTKVRGYQRNLGPSVNVNAGN